MPIIGAAPHVHQDRRATFYSELGGGSFLNAQLLNRLWREQDCRNSYYARLVNCGITIVAVIVIQSVDEVIVRGGASAIDADSKKSTAGRTLYARSNR